MLEWQIPTLVLTLSYILNGSVPFRYFTAEVHSFRVGVILDCGTTVELFIIIVSVSCLLHCVTMVHVQCLVLLELLVCKQRDLCLLWKALCDQSSWTYSHVRLWMQKNKDHGPLFIVWVLYWVSFLLWLVWHVWALPKVIQGSCLVSGDDAYMGTCQKYHLMDASLSLLWRCWNHHLVTHSILLNPKVFMATDSFV